MTNLPRFTLSTTLISLAGKIEPATDAAAVKDGVAFAVKARSAVHASPRAANLEDACAALGLELAGREIVIGSRYAMAIFTRSELEVSTFGRAAVQAFDAQAKAAKATKLAAAKALVAFTEAQAQAVAEAKALIAASEVDAELVAAAGPVVAEVLAELEAAEA